jgi:DNA-binding NtrC family response regulator
VKDQLESLVKEMIERGILYTDAVAEFEKKFIKRMLEENNGNHSKAAVALGIHRNTLSRKVEGLGLDHRPKRRAQVVAR